MIASIIYIIPYPDGRVACLSCFLPCPSFAGFYQAEDVMLCATDRATALLGLSYNTLLRIDSKPNPKMESKG